MDNIIERISSLKLDYRLANKDISIVSFADDATLLAETEDDLQR